MQPLLKLALVQTYQVGWLVTRVSCVRIPRILQKILREDDTARTGVSSILMANKSWLFSNYITSQATIAILSAVLQVDLLTMRWLLCYGQTLENSRRRGFRVNNSAVVPRLEFGAAEVEQLRQSQDKVRRSEK